MIVHVRPSIRSFLSLALLASATILAFGFAKSAQQDLVIYNHSPSLPVGLYVRTDSPIQIGAIVTVRALDVAGEMARIHHFTGLKDRFIKHVAATAGDQVCSFGDTITINGSKAAYRLRHDSAGRELSGWTGCRLLDAQDVFLLGDTADSFDGRYWGGISRSKIEGVWRPLHF